MSWRKHEAISKPIMHSHGLEVPNTSRPRHHTVTVIENRALSRRYYLLALSRPKGLQEPGPGTFVHLVVPDQRRFFLRRPFSIMDCDDKTISLIIVEKGEGTSIMRAMQVGQKIDLIGPLGSAFPTAPDKRVLAIGGGVGLAPLYYYWMRSKPGDYGSFRLLYGARSKEDLFIDNFDWSKQGAKFSSDDGSYGFSGTVVEFAQREIERSPADVIFSCGPNPMLKAAQDFARVNGLQHYVSLENRMACALGACRSCVVLTRANDGVRYRTVCRDGPVFDARVLVWEKLPQA
ncbi:MAG: dihydroorotate dehydrogenase electron transfer subunit [Candidatus Krumholzibacteria bacterium]|nr:dihydroorotate dehydrogenase electron transfer subunit [Candidatus Krumholzibacteria bacterium]